MKRRLGEILVSWGRLTRARLRAALVQQRTWRARLGTILLSRRWITEADLARAISEQLGIPTHDFSQPEPVDVTLLSLVPPDFAHARKLIPVARHGDELTVAMADPLDREAIDRVEAVTGLRVRVVIAPESEIRSRLEEAPEARAEPQPSVTAARAGRRPKRGQALLVDDSPTMVHLVRAVLEGEGFEVVTASDGLEALERVSQLAPDLVVTDAVMPRLDGLGLLQALKGQATTLAIPVIVLSSDEDTGRSQTFGLRADEYISKSLPLEEFLSRIRTALARACPDR